MAHGSMCGEMQKPTLGGVPPHPSISLRNAKNSHGENWSAGKAGRAGKAGVAHTCECECHPALARQGAEGDLQCPGEFGD